MSKPSSAEPTDFQWYVVGRWQAFAGEAQTNMLRVAAVAGFYAIQLLNYLTFSTRSGPEQAFQRAVTLIAAAWLFLSLAVLVSLQRRFFPAALQHVVAIADVLLLTAACSIGSGSASPLVAVYFLLIALGALRNYVSLVWTSTLGAMVGYLCLVAIKDPTWFDANHATPVVNQLVTLLSLALTGFVMGLIVRRTRGIASQFADRLAAGPPERTPT